jgi:hypothetical protein
MVQRRRCVYNNIYDKYAIAAIINSYYIVVLVTLVQCLAASKRLAWTIFSYLFDPNPTDVTTVLQLNTLLESDYALFVYMTCKKASRINAINKRERQKAAGKDEEEIEQKLGSDDESSKCDINDSIHLSSSSSSSSSSSLSSSLSHHHYHQQ